MLDPHRTELIALEAVKVLIGTLADLVQDDSDHGHSPFYRGFTEASTKKLPINYDFPNLVSLSSWMHGLSTTLGQTFFENVAHILSDGEKRAFTKKASTSLKITEKQQITIAKIVTDLKNGAHAPNLENEDALLMIDAAGESGYVDASDFTADNLVEDAEFIEAIELKTVKPNAGGLQGEKQKILGGKAALKNEFPNKAVRFFFGFPFDPLNTNPTGFDKHRFLASIVEGTKYLDPNEVLLADELWDRLSGNPNTMQDLLDVINRIATPEFLDNFIFLADSKNALADPNRYGELLDRWELHREKFLFENRTKPIIAKLERKRNQHVFSQDGEYNLSRYLALSEALK